MEAKLLLIPWLASVLYSSIPLFWFAIHPNAFVTFPLTIWLEERELDARFGKDFRDYKRAVPLFPRNFLFRASATAYAKNESGVIGERS